MKGDYYQWDDKTQGKKRKECCVSRLSNYVQEKKNAECVADQLKREICEDNFQGKSMPFTLRDKSYNRRRGQQENTRMTVNYR